MRHADRISFQLVKTECESREIGKSADGFWFECLWYFCAKFCKQAQFAAHSKILELVNRNVFRPRNRTPFMHTHRQIESSGTMSKRQHRLSWHDGCCCYQCFLLCCCCGFIENAIMIIIHHSR